MLSNVTCILGPCRVSQGNLTSVILGKDLWLTDLETFLGKARLARHILTRHRSVVTDGVLVDPDVYLATANLTHFIETSLVYCVAFAHAEKPEVNLSRDSQGYSHGRLALVEES